MKVLVTGAAGQVAQALRHKGAGHPRHQLVFAARPDFDLTDAGSIRRAVAQAAPDVVISAAAYTAVDKAEDDADTAHACNAVAPRILAEACKEAGAGLIHFSTDYVFDGSGDRARREDDPTAPLNVYGKTKWQGEEAVRATLSDHLILRTAWVYSPFGANFVKTMLTLARSRDEVRVVADQHGNPTSALDIADALFAVLDQRQANSGAAVTGTFHLAGTGDATWSDLAAHVMACSAQKGGPSARVIPIPSVEFPTKARRPANSRLDSSRFASVFGYAMPHWRQSATDVVWRLLEAE